MLMEPYKRTLPMKEEYTRHIYYYKNYYLDFFRRLNADVKEKFNWTFKLIATIEIVPENYLKQIENTDELYEVRVEDGSDIYRVFCFFDNEKLIVLINGFRKRSKRTSIKEIEMAERIKKAYFYEKIRNKFLKNDKLQLTCKYMIIDMRFPGT